jgi:hypothetical protein
MKRRCKERGMVAGYALTAGVILALVSFVGLVIAPEGPLATTMRILPEHGVVKTDTPFAIDLYVDADEPVNVFKGVVHFDPTKLRVASIDYNTSIAELWAERPWYANGEGTINFIGGTTKAGGFNGSGALMRITFEPISIGEVSINIEDVRILAHDGFGSDVPLTEPLDALFTVEDAALDAETVSRQSKGPAAIAVVSSLPKTDLNNDGVQSIADVSIFIAGLVFQKPELDFNEDGSVDTADLSILMSAK